jgi:hypothetical protein
MELIIACYTPWKGCAERSKKQSRDRLNVVYWQCDGKNCPKNKLVEKYISSNTLIVPKD